MAALGIRPPPVTEEDEYGAAGLNPAHPVKSGKSCNQFFVTKCLRRCSIAGGTQCQKLFGTATFSV